jgi:hypothetical protein
MILVYRKHNNGSLWHFHTQCPHWPEITFKPRMYTRLEKNVSVKSALGSNLKCSPKRNTSNTLLPPYRVGSICHFSDLVDNPKASNILGFKAMAHPPVQRVTIEMSLPAYEGFVEKCKETSREYSPQKRGDFSTQHQRP